jgi:hypothetical protein
MSSPSTGALVVKNVQYAEESSYGVFPTNPAMLWIGAIQHAELKGDMQTIMVPQLGTEDLKYQMKGAEVYTLDLEYAFQTSTFAKYGTQSQGGGAGTIDKSLSLLMSAKMSGTENYIQMTGARIDSLTISSKTGDYTRVKCTVKGKAIPVPSASNPIGSGSFASDPGTAPYSFYSGGTNPINIGGVTPDVREISVSFARNLDPLHVLGQSQHKFLPPKHRRITGSFNLVWEDTNQYTNLTAGTTINTLTWPINFGGPTLTLNNLELNRLESWRFDPTEVVFEKYGCTALTASLS